MWRNSAVLKGVEKITADLCREKHAQKCQFNFTHLKEYQVSQSEINRKLNGEDMLTFYSESDSWFEGSMMFALFKEMFVINECRKNDQQTLKSKIDVLRIKPLTSYLETQRKIKSKFQKYKLCHIRTFKIFRLLFIACFIHYWNFSQFYFCWYKSWPLNLIYNFLSNFVQSKTWREIHIIASLIGWTFFCLSINCF